MNAIKNRTEKEGKGFDVVDFNLPKCDIDGSFAPVQCKNNK